MKKSRKPESFIQKTTYPGGLDQLRIDIMNLMVYPEEALKLKVEGNVVVIMDIDNKGKVESAKIKMGLGHGLDEEALRIATALRFSATNNRGVRVTFHETLNIRFSIREYLKHKQMKDAASMIDIKVSNPGLQIGNMQITYTTTATAQKPAQTVTKDVKYSYTITVNKPETE